MGRVNLYDDIVQSVRQLPAGLSSVCSLFATRSLSSITSCCLSHPLTLWLEDIRARMDVQTCLRPALRVSRHTSNCMRLIFVACRVHVKCCPLQEYSKLIHLYDSTIHLLMLGIPPDAGDQSPNAQESLVSPLAGIDEWQS